MRSLSALIDYYFSTIYPSLYDLELKRRKVAQRLRLLQIVSVLLGLLIALIGWHRFENEFEALLFAIAGSTSLYAFGYKILISGYKDDFKERVIKKIIHFIEPNLRYSPFGSISKEEFFYSGIFLKDIDRFSGNDLVEGEIDGVHIKFSDIKAEYKSRHKNKEHWHTLFEGIFFIADLNKHFQGRIVVLPDTMQKILGHFAQTLQSYNLQRDKLIKMDNPAFEKEFVVYADDEITSRYILTQSMMERILRYKQKTQKDIYLAFKNSKVYLAIASGKDLFEPDPFKPLNDLTPLKSYYENFELLLTLIEDLKLNRKIWAHV